jgi:hypothetical protein
VAPSSRLCLGAPWWDRDSRSVPFDRSTARLLVHADYPRCHLAQPLATAILRSRSGWTRERMSWYLAKATHRSRQPKRRRSLLRINPICARTVARAVVETSIEVTPAAKSRRHQTAASPPRRPPAATACFEIRQHAAGTRRVRQPEHAQARAGTADTFRIADLQEKRAREYPRVYAVTAPGLPW